MPPASSTTARKIVQVLHAFERRADPFHWHWRDVRKATQKALKTFTTQPKGHHLTGERPTAGHRMPHSTTKDTS